MLFSMFSTKIILQIFYSPKTESTKSIQLQSSVDKLEATERDVMCNVEHSSDGCNSNQRESGFESIEKTLSSEGSSSNSFPEDKLFHLSKRDSSMSIDSSCSIESDWSDEELEEVDMYEQAPLF